MGTLLGQLLSWTNNWYYNNCAVGSDTNECKYWTKRCSIIAIVEAIISLMCYILEWDWTGDQRLGESVSTATYMLCGDD